jgi:hypothetical protein
MLTFGEQPDFKQKRLILFTSFRKRNSNILSAQVFMMSFYKAIECEAKIQTIKERKPENNLIKAIQS